MAITLMPEDAMTIRFPLKIAVVITFVVLIVTMFGLANTPAPPARAATLGPIIVAAPTQDMPTITLVQRRGGTPPVSQPPPPRPPAPPVQKGPSGSWSTPTYPKSAPPARTVTPERKAASIDKTAAVQKKLKADHHKRELEKLERERVLRVALERSRERAAASGTRRVIGALLLGTALSGPVMHPQLQARLDIQTARLAGHPGNTTAPIVRAPHGPSAGPPGPHDGLGASPPPPGSGGPGQPPRLPGLKEIFNRVAIPVPHLSIRNPPATAHPDVIRNKAPLGFTTDQFNLALRELRAAMVRDGLSGTIGVRGSSLTGRSRKPDGSSYEFDHGPGGRSDIDLFVESAAFKAMPRNSFGLIRPRDIKLSYPNLDAWQSRWQLALGRKLSVGGFLPSAVPSDQPFWRVIE